MIVYSKKIIRFVKDIKSTIKDILTKEVGLKVHGNRFYDRRQWASYPIKVVVYNNKSMLGYFDPGFFELGFHETLMHTGREKLNQVIRHEVAHYINFMDYGATIQAHGPEFREFCQRMQWDEEVGRATICLESGIDASGIEESPILRKVQKLMALSASSNQNEAELAMIKSQQLLMKHNIESKYVGGDEAENEKVFLKRIMKQKKENAKMRSIAIMLETFFVSTVYNRAEGHIYLEIMGEADNVEIAEYVAHVLDGELENLWHQAQMKNNLKGAVAKNSFFLGIAKGYCNKIEVLKREYGNDVANALMVIEKKLIDAKDMVYDRLTNTKRGGSHCHESAALGEQMGRQLNINPALGRSGKNSEALIGYAGY